MFDIGWDEMAVVAVIALIVIGPKDLPHVLRAAGRFVRKARDMAGEFQRGVDDMVREAELDELKKQVEKHADPTQLQREIEAAVDGDGAIAKSLEPPRLDEVAPEPKAQPKAEAPQPALPPARPPEP